jgi:hypothetical protein
MISQTINYLPIQNHHRKIQHISNHNIMPESHHHSLTDDATLAVGATGAVVAADQLLKMTDDEEDKTGHLLKASVGAAVAVGAWELLRRAEADGKPIRRYGDSSRSRSRSRSRSSSRNRSSSRSSQKIKHHKRHVLEEVIGAYSLGREILGDRKHHVTHLVGEALGATGLIQELRARDKLDEEDRSRR